MVRPQVPCEGCKGPTKLLRALEDDVLLASRHAEQVRFKWHYQRVLGWPAWISLAVLCILSTLCLHALPR